MLDKNCNLYMYLHEAQTISAKGKFFIIAIEEQ